MRSVAPCARVRVVKRAGTKFVSLCRSLRGMDPKRDCRMNLSGNGQDGHSSSRISRKCRISATPCMLERQALSLHSALADTFFSSRVGYGCPTYTKFWLASPQACAISVASQQCPKSVDNILETRATVDCRSVRAGSLADQDGRHTVVQEPRGRRR